MKLKISQGITLSQKQVIEIGKTIMREPDYGWELEDARPEEKYKYEVRFEGEYGIYEYRVNISWNMITILNVE